MFVLEPFHFFLEERILGVEFFVCSVDLESLLDFFLHVVAVLLELADHLFLGIGAFFSCSGMLLKFFLQVAHFVLMAPLLLWGFFLRDNRGVLLSMVLRRIMVWIKKPSWLGSRAGIFAMVEQACLGCLPKWPLLGLFVTKMHAQTDNFGVFFTRWDVKVFD
jgi:hypothetical protein